MFVQVRHLRRGAEGCCYGELQDRTYAAAFVIDPAAFEQHYSQTEGLRGTIMKIEQYDVQLSPIPTIRIRRLAPACRGLPVAWAGVGGDCSARVPRVGRGCWGQNRKRFCG